MLTILFVAPVVLTVPPKHGYGGIEWYIYDFAKYMSDKGFNVAMACSIGSQLPDGVVHIPTVEPVGGFDAESELKAYNVYANSLDRFDVIHDFSHQKVVGRKDRGRTHPLLNMMWHNCESFVPVPNYNLVSLSDWQNRRLRFMYGINPLKLGLSADETKYRQTNGKREKFLFVGRAQPDRGAVDAIRFANEANVALDVISSKLPNEDPTYLYEIISKSKSSTLIEHYSTFTDKVKMISEARGMILPYDRDEAHSLTVVEGMLCGTPVLAYKRGALPEIIKHGYSGFMLDTPEAFVKAIEYTDLINNDECRKWGMQFSHKRVMAKYIETYKSVANGYRWY
jgi:glycosyltransferase involved in cell wall biosynthesis